jgi:hypothetical protein
MATIDARVRAGDSFHLFSSSRDEQISPLGQRFAFFPPVLELKPLAGEWCDKTARTSINKLNASVGRALGSTFALPWAKLT